MKSLKRPLLLILLSALAACAATPPAAPLASPASAPVADASAPAASDNSARWPKQALTPEWMFGVLASEIAAQRGAVDSAAVTSLALARQTRDPRLAERAAQFALAAGNLSVAREALTFWLSLDPEAIAAREQLIVVALRAGDLTQSQRLLRELLQRQPEMAPAVFVQLARLGPLQTDKHGAYGMVDSLVAPYANLPEAHFALLAVAAEDGQQAVVDREFDRLAVLAPKWDLPVAWQAERLRKVQPAAATAFLAKELARRPDASLELKMAYPRLLVAQKQFVLARSAFEVLLKQNPRQPELLYATGLLAFQLNDLPTARLDLEAALAEHYPDADFLRYSLGQITEAQNDLPAASQWYGQVTRGAQYTPAQVRLAYLDAQAGKPELAIARLGKLEAKGEERVQLVLAQAEIARASKHYDLGRSVLSQALQHDPKRAELLYERALIADLQHDTVAAERDLRLLLKQHPNDQQALNALGYILTTRTTRYQEAYGLIERALKLEPDNAMILDSMGWVMFKLGHGDAALKYLARAYGLLPDQEVAAHYGEVLWSTGHQDEARALWNKAKQSAGDHPELDETMQRLLRP